MLFESFSHQHCRTAVWCKLFASALKGKIAIAFRNEESRDTVVTQPFLFINFLF